VLAFLRRGAFLKGPVGAVVACVFALQMLLAGIAATQMAAADPADPFVICYGSGHAPDGDAGSNKGIPVHHAACAICVLASFSPPVPEIAALQLARSSELAALHLAPQAHHGPASKHDPRSSQGPPQTA
jgi:hypothetical protein